ncbi:MAG: hypothetical protein EP332_09325 [Bacteroidetes bacterium]|nr:MAG: hypothetical protein EP332_09325 [Bacteroidota bacterium]
MEPILETQTKYYNAKTISIATFIGGPLVTGLLMRRNFRNAGDDSSASRALLLGILATVLIFGSVFYLPEAFVDKIPKSIIPAAYTLLASLLVKKYQGEVLETHEEQGGKYYSVWRAIGISLLCIAPFIVALVIALQAGPSLKDSNLYNDAIDRFTQNEEEALALYPLLEQGNERVIAVFIEDKGLPLWKENLTILQNMEALTTLSDEHTEQIKSLREYCELRIQIYELIHKAILEQSDQYDSKIDELNKKLEIHLENG